LGKLAQPAPASRHSGDAQIPQLEPVNGSPSLALESIGLAQPKPANQGARDSSDLLPPYTNSSAGKYFEAGRFKEPLRADRAVEELGQLGFHAIIVPTHVLWMNSYHILVGPYGNQGEVEVARHRLESHGFDPRVLQSKSKRFSLPAMTLYGTDQTIRDCIVTWQLNSPDATVEFMRGRNIVATAKGTWEKRDFAFKSNAIVSRDNDRGPGTLLEIQRAGTDQGLVLEGSGLRFYLAQ
jgi:hypothetical protein